MNELVAGFKFTYFVNKGEMFETRNECVILQKYNTYKEHSSNINILNTYVTLQVKTTNSFPELLKIEGLEKFDFKTPNCWIFSDLESRIIELISRNAGS